MISFRNDYSEGAHPSILDALIKNNNSQEEGYGLDRHTQAASKYIKKLIENDEADIHLLSAGTQTNLVAISSFLRPHEACIAAETGHIATHEAGAIEATGHKILTIRTKDGKLTPELISPVLVDHHFEHMVKPKLVYISNPTELGTVYSRVELKALYEYCKSQNLKLYADGARLGSAIMIKGSDVTLKDMYNLTDAFFIGGTKNGCLLGEALVLKNIEVKEEIRYLIKQRGALLAKGRVIGIQFEELFKNNLYFDLANHANIMAQNIAEELKKNECKFLIDSPTNQIFPILKNSAIEALSKEFYFYTWAKVDEECSAIRIVTSWATTKESIDRFIKVYKQVI